MKAISFAGEVKSWIGGTRCCARSVMFLMGASLFVMGDGIALGQCADAVNDGTCSDASSDTCDPNLNHGNGARIGPGATCVGETLRMTGEWFFGDSFLDAWKATDGTLTVDGVPQGTQPIILIAGNAVCTGGAACTGALPNAGCTFPCMIGPPAVRVQTEGLLFRGLLPGAWFDLGPTMSFRLVIMENWRPTPSTRYLLVLVLAVRLLNRPRTAGQSRCRTATTETTARSTAARQAFVRTSAIARALPVVTSTAT